MNRKLLSLISLSLVVGALIGTVVVRWILFPKEFLSKPQIQRSRPEKHILYWRNPMNPSIHADHPMKDNMGMDYIPVYGEPAGSLKNSVAVDSRIQQTLGIQVFPVVRRTFSRTIRTAATVSFDRRRIRTVSIRFRGWIRELTVLAPGDLIRKGALLAQVYSPELASSEKEALIALGATRSDPKSKDDRSLWEAAQERLRLLGVPDSEIGRLEKTGLPRSVLPVTSPYSGIVATIAARVGGEISPDKPLMTLVDLSRVWVDVALYVDQLNWVKPGDPVTFHIPAVPSRVYRGTMHFVDPRLNRKSRTVRARVPVENTDGFLKPGMYLEATLHPDPRPDVLIVPRKALIRTEKKTIVITEIGRGHFRPVRVTVGVRSDHWVEVLSGLHEGDQVVVSGQFLLDAESQFENVSDRMEKGGRP
ncbi:MAG: Secretion protein (HlyD) [Leptospirillum rubarum]|jgi:Cu(I)/Ag(I) efflux system membrane fusion protein|nr:MAG: Secretion protein (HlyD) [Leptospirillum rubarum]